METVRNRTTSIVDEIYNLVSRMQEARAIRQWKKNAKDKNSFEMNKLQDVLPEKKNEIGSKEENKKRELANREEEEQHREEIRHQERPLWREKFQVELGMTEKKLAMESETPAKRNSPN